MPPAPPSQSPSPPLHSLSVTRPSDGSADGYAVQATVGAHAGAGAPGTRGKVSFYFVRIFSSFNCRHSQPNLLPPPLDPSEQETTPSPSKQGLAIPLRGGLINIYFFRRQTDDFCAVRSILIPIVVLCTKPLFLSALWLAALSFVICFDFIWPTFPQRSLFSISLAAER